MKRMPDAKPTPDLIGNIRQQAIAATNIAASIGEDLKALGPVQVPPSLAQPTGTEHLCAGCAEQPGAIVDPEGRLLCPACDEERSVIQVDDDPDRDPLDVRESDQF